MFEVTSNGYPLSDSFRLSDQKLENFNVEALVLFLDIWFSGVNFRSSIFLCVSALMA